MKKQKIIYIVISLIIIIIVGFLVFRGDKSEENSNQPDSIANLLNLGGESESVDSEVDTEASRKSTDSNNLNQTYFDSQYGFSFQYPNSLQITTFNENNLGDVVLAQGPNNTGFQIFITPFDESVVLTADFVKKDLPNLIMKNPQQAILGDGTRALIFLSEDSALGETREVWFSKGGFLYQISAYATLDVWLAKIMDTWRFQ